MSAATRVRLLYGEWLRRENRSVHAREQLRVAHDRFSGIGAKAFADRARVELLATGETVRNRRADSRDELTPGRRTGAWTSDSRARAMRAGETLLTPATDRKERIMSTPQLTTIPSPPEGQDLATVPTRFEVTPIPVTDVDRAKTFYQRLGWRLDIDAQFTEQVRAVQFTPTGSSASIQFAPAGADRLQRLLLIVDDIEAARTELVDRGIDVGEIFHALPGEAPQPGRDPDGRSYVSHAAFTDPDGNQWILQEVTDRIAGRV